MDSTELFKSFFGPIQTTISNGSGKLNVKMNSGTSTIFSKSYPNNENVDSKNVSNIQHPHRITEHNDGNITKFSYFFDGIKSSEIGINHQTHRVSFVSSFDNNSNDEDNTGFQGNVENNIKLTKLIPHLMKDGSNENTYVFEYTGVNQTLAIPSTAKEVIVECWGAGGASQGTGSLKCYNTGYGGGGGYTKSILKGISGQTVNVVVGQGGLSTIGGANAAATFGGGGSQQLAGDTNWGAASGGGRSAIQLMVNGAYQDIVTAGGGGAAGGNTASGASDYVGIGSGGPGGGSSGANAEVYENLPIYGGIGGSQTSGGSNGSTATGKTSSTYNATLGIGGGGNQYGAGGGGGYYGGGYGGITAYNGLVNVDQTINDSISTNGIVLWLDAADSSSVVVDSTGAVSQWNDKSRYAANAVPFVGSCQYSSKGLNGVLPGITMNQTSLYSPLATGTFNNGVTMFVVFSSNGGQTYGTLVTRTDTSKQNYPGPWDMYNTTRAVGNNINIGSATSTNNVNSSMSPSIFAYQSSSVTPINEWINGTNYFTSSKQSYYKDTGSFVYLGSRGDKVTSFSGVMSEIILYNRVLNITEMNTVQEYLASKWQISASTMTETNTSAQGSGSYCIFGGGGGGSSYVNPSYGAIIKMDQADGNKVAGSENLPHNVKGSIGNGADINTTGSSGFNGQNGYVVIKIRD